MSSSKFIYLDYAATSPVDKQVALAMQNYLCMENDLYGNSASAHHYGNLAKQAIKTAREKIAECINAVSYTDIVFTSGATESNNLALKGVAEGYIKKGKHIITCKTEHKSILDTCYFLEKKGFDVTYLDVDKNGFINLEYLENLVKNRKDDTILVSIMHVNNEIGVIQDISKIINIIKNINSNILVHVDAVQSLGKLKIDVQKLGVDLMSFSGHKIYGPKGIGALFVRSKPIIKLEPQLHGGGHENGLRSGTLPTQQIVGFAKACEICIDNMQAEQELILEKRSILQERLLNIDGVYINGSIDKRIAGNLNISVDGIAENMNLLDNLPDIAVSAGSACNNNTLESSYVLQAIGVPPNLAKNSLRISIGRYTSFADIDYTVQYINDAILNLRGKL